MTANKAKNVNYSAEAEATIVAIFATAGQSAADSVKAAATALGKSSRSIVAKASRMGLYRAAEKVSKVTGDKPITKAAMVSQIAAKIGCNEEDVASLEGATKMALQLVLENLPEVTQ